LHKTNQGFAGISPVSSVMLEQRLSKQIVLYKGLLLFILYNRAARDYTSRDNVLIVFWNFAVLRLRHCG